MSVNEISITQFDGEQSVADVVAQLHLAIRLEQVADGVNKFSDIHSSQLDLRGMQMYYVEPGGNFWIARDDRINRIVGFVGLKKVGDGIGELKRMTVIPEYRRRHIGQRLGETAVDWAAEHGFNLIELATGEEENAYDMYRKLGFDAGFEMGAQQSG